MKRSLIILFLTIHLFANAQKTLFTAYSDSLALVTDANHLITDFVHKVNSIKPVITSKPVAILNTKPYLIFYSPQTNKVNLPIWHQVIQPQKEFFYNLSESETAGKEVFGLFFNGFYLPHELGHALKKALNVKDSNLYANEYFANVIAVLYWRSVNRDKELELCYQYARKFVSQLKNPVPEGQDEQAYFNSHYNELGADPYKCAYFQFKQFIQVYEDETLGSFTNYLKKFMGNLK